MERQQTRNKYVSLGSNQNISKAKNKIKFEKTKNKEIKGANLVQI